MQFLLEAPYILKLFLNLLLVIAILGWFIYKGFKSKKSGRILLIGILLNSLLIATFFGAIFSEMYFRLNHDSFYYYQSKIKEFEDLSGFKYDLKLVDNDTSADYLLISEDVFSESKLEKSPNASYTLQENGEIFLSSTNNKPAYLELVLTKSLHYPEKLFQAFFSVLIKNSRQGTGYLSIFIDSGEEAVFYNDSPADNKYHLLSGFFYRELHTNGNEFYDADYQFRVRIYTEGAGVSFARPRLTAVRIYPQHDFDFERFRHQLSQELPKEFKDSANKMFFEAVNRKKDDATIRILSMGGSTTFGYGTGPSTTYPLLLKGLLNAGLESRSGKRYEVINVGQNGNTTFGMLYQLDRTDFSSLDPKNNFPHLRAPIRYTKYTLMDLEPDVVFIAPMFNDLYYGWGHGYYTAYGTDKEITKAEKINTFLKFDLANRFKSLSFVKYNAIGYYAFEFYHKTLYSIFDEKLLANYGSGDYENNLVTDYRKRLSLLVKKLLDNDVKVVLLQFPHMPETEGEEFYLKIKRRDKEVISEVAENLGVPFLDLTEDNNNQYQDEKYWYDYVHPSGYGYMDYATKIFNRMFPIPSLEQGPEWD